ncbi:MAG: cysteine dioxygenase family protein [Gaiellales bacterium]
MATTTPLFVPALDSLGDLVPHDGVLSPEELEEVAAQIAARPDIWEPLVRIDRAQRRYELVYDDDRMDAWVLSWMPGHGTGFHDHYISSVGIHCVRGAVREDQMRYGMPALERTLTPGSRRHGNPAYIHRVQHLEGEPAVTIHVYSPRLDWVGQYRVDDDGVVRREIQPGRNELTDQLISEGALQGVLERF